MNKEKETTKKVREQRKILLKEKLWMQILIILVALIMITATHKVILNNVYDGDLQISKTLKPYKQAAVVKSEAGDGWSTTVAVGNRTYRNYKQYEGSYASKEFWPHGEYTTISGAGCGPTSVAIVLSGYGFDDGRGGHFHNV